MSDVTGDRLRFFAQMATPGLTVDEMCAVIAEATRHIEAYQAVEKAAREVATAFRPWRAVRRRTAIADLEDAHHVTRMEWFEAREMDLHASLVDALQALDDVRRTGGSE